MAGKKFPDRGDGQNVVMPGKGIILMCVGKCASSALKGMAKATDKNSYKVTKDQVEREGGLQDFRCIAIVRNPYARLVSVWRDKTQKKGRLYRGFRGIRGMRAGMPFRNFARVVHGITDDHPLLDGHFRSQSDILVSEKGELLPDIVIPFEEIEYGWTVIAENYGLPDPLHVVNSGGPSSGDFVRFYEGDKKREARGLCETRYMEDFLNFYPNCLNSSTNSDPRDPAQMLSRMELASKHRSTTIVLPDMALSCAAEEGERGPGGSGMKVEPPAVDSPFDADGDGRGEGFWRSVDDSFSF